MLLLIYTREEIFVFIEKSLVTRHFNSGVPEPEDTSSVQEIWFLLHITQDFWSKFGKWQYTATCYNCTTAQHGNFNLFQFQNDQITGQHDRQDERLTGQLPNRFGHCPLTGRYFEPCGIHFILKSSNQVLQNITLHIKYMYNRLEPQVKNNVKFADSI